MSLALARIVRHPIKAIGFEELAGAELTPGEALPFDRVWAVAHAGAKVGPDLAEWAPKVNFLRGVAGPELMAITAESVPDERRVTLHHPMAGQLSAAPDAVEDQARLLAWLAPLWPEGRLPPAFVASVPGRALTDVPSPFVSILNLASNRTLGERLGRALSIHRWRGNLWLDGLEAFAEFDLVGRRLRIGVAELKVERRITRCKATTVNPETGRPDADTLGALRSGWGHEDFGVYATVTLGGPIRLDDPVEVLG